MNNETVIAVSERSTLSPKDTDTISLFSDNNLFSWFEKPPSGPIKTAHLFIEFLYGDNLSIMDWFVSILSLQ